MLSYITWAEYSIIVAGALIFYYGWYIKKYATSFGWEWPKPGQQPVDGRMAALYAAPAADGTNATITSTNQPNESTSKSAEATAVQKDPVTSTKSPAESPDTPSESVQNPADLIGPLLLPALKSPSLEIDDTSIHAPSEIPTVTAAESPTGVAPIPHNATPPTEPDSPPHPFLSLLAADLIQSVTNLAESPSSQSQPETLTKIRQLLTTPPYHRLKGTPYQDKITQTILQIINDLGSTQIDLSMARGLWDG